MVPPEQQISTMSALDRRLQMYNGFRPTLYIFQPEQQISTMSALDGRLQMYAGFRPTRLQQQQQIARCAAATFHATGGKRASDKLRYNQTTKQTNEW